MTDPQFIRPSWLEIMSVGALRIHLRTLRRRRDEEPDPTTVQELSAEVYRVDTLIKHKEAAND